MPSVPETNGGFLSGVRVLEVADELGEYCGKVLAGLGADVVKVEPPAGESTRRIGPFYEDRAGPERSLHFWHYNFGKRGLTLDLDRPEGQSRFRELARRADVVLETRPRGFMDERGLGSEALRALSPSLVVARISPFGDSGPWAGYRGSDLVHLALGGTMMNCGYDPDPTGAYDTPPIAPQMWQSYHVAGEMTAIAIIGALHWRLSTGRGQHLSTAVHDAVAKQTEGDIADWEYQRVSHGRKTARHSMPFTDDIMSIALTKDGRWILPYHTYLGRAQEEAFDRTVAILAKHGMAEDLTEPKYADPAYRAQKWVGRHVTEVVKRFFGAFLFERDAWREFQEAGLTAAPLRLPEENAADAHWRGRQTFLEVEHPELRRTFTEIGAKWMSPQVPWRSGPRAPLLGEHTDEILRLERSEGARALTPHDAPTPRMSRRGKPFALAGARVVDLGWVLASGGAGRFLASLGAEVIKVEHVSRPDTLRWAMGLVPPGGRAERERASAPIRVARAESPNRSGHFMDINAGKRAISLNLKEPRGRELLANLIRTADVVAEGFSPGAMERMGFGYERLRELNPRIVYVQQSGMGQSGIYGRVRSYGPVAQAFSGLTEMSGLPAPFPPAGIGYSYLDWFGAYNMALAMLAGMYRQRTTGQGCWIDSSQVEAGTYLTGTALLDHSANGRSWQRTGNRSPYKRAAPHGAYRARGDDRWIAIACFDETDWNGLRRVLGDAAWDAPALATLESRLAHQDELDALVERATMQREPNTLMADLQAAGVAAGICQTAEDRYEHDPQLRHLEWLVDLRQTEIGTWPVKEFPVKMSETPPYMGGTVDRHGPSYGEDNDYVFGELLGLDAAARRALAEAGII